METQKLQWGFDVFPHLSVMKEKLFCRIAFKQGKNVPLLHSVSAVSSVTEMCPEWITIHLQSETHGHIRFPISHTFFLKQLSPL